ncbi:acyltransferase [Rahnella sp. PD12R]|uniref:acyltransferase family protein n=1 Tax=Rahnella sp. PD12R TaxID=2855688 RepID=UPI001C4714A2|nr:acyltransferase [Rahnella sp. PD12R]MBV6817495.1 acyltransferase [Rahnella sp. PD12R]
MKNKIIFADQLRVVAFLCVVTVHWMATYFVMPQLVSDLTRSPLYSAVDPGLYLKLFPPFLPYFNFGPFGVAIFFIISGFVIPFSCRAKSAKGFLAARLLRIYPVYILCAIITILTVLLTSRYYWGIDAHYSIKEIVSNLTLTHTLLLTGSIDVVNWTLAIEVKFYIVCLLLRQLIIKNKYYPFIIISLITIAINRFNLQSAGQLPKEMVFISFMFIGVLFNYLYTGAISLHKFISLAVLQFYLFYAGMRYSELAHQYETEVMSAAYAMLMFSFCYVFRDSFRDNVILRYLSGISFPFYALHCVIGFSLLRILSNEGISYKYSFVISFIAITALASLVHFSVEKSSIRLGKRIK